MKWTKQIIIIFACASSLVACQQNRPQNLTLTKVGATPAQIVKPTAESVSPIPDKSNRSIKDVSLLLREFDRIRDLVSLATLGDEYFAQRRDDFKQTDCLEKKPLFDGDARNFSLSYRNCLVNRGEITERIISGLEYFCFDNKGLCQEACAVDTRAVPTGTVSICDKEPILTEVFRKHQNLGIVETRRNLSISPHDPKSFVIQGLTRSFIRKTKAEPPKDSNLVSKLKTPDDEWTIEIAKMKLERASDQSWVVWFYNEPAQKSSNSLTSYAKFDVSGTGTKRLVYAVGTEDLRLTQNTECSSYRPEGSLYLMWAQDGSQPKRLTIGKDQISADADLKFETLPFMGCDALKPRTSPKANR